MDVALGLAGIFIVCYVIVLRSAIQQRHDSSTLEAGERVLTSSGFYATVRAITTHEERPVEITLEVAPGVELRGMPDAVAGIVKPGAGVRAEAP